MSKETVKKLLGLLELDDFDFLRNLRDIRQNAESLAELAFRLRDETLHLKEGRVHLRQAITRILTYKGCKLCGQYEKATWKISDYKIWRWFALARPTEIIIAALIAKEIGNEAEIQKAQKQ